ncbi:MAG: glycine--tRNA ligase subunit beta [Thermodesulfobacteriota bacterium]|nr:MAG: glycine--tRNA ligase subunit beta [Thermodesulfobacteriota bacterium]
MTGELLLEIGTEEIPAGFLSPALEGMKNLLQTELETQRIHCENIFTFGTPRRLVLCAEGMAEKQADTVVDTVGPPAKVAFDANGNPTKAAESFALRQGVALSDLGVVDTPKGRYIQVTKKISGKETISLLPEFLEKVISAIPFPKSMRWANSDVRFVRPIKWILALFNNTIIPLSIDTVKSSNQSWGHRFLSNQPFTVQDVASYLQQSEENFVMPEIEKRKASIQRDAQRLAEEVGGKVLADEDLLDEVVNLIEYPVTLRGSFAPAFLELPRDVLISSMREHQKYFALIDAHDALLPYFIVVSNNRARDPQVVIKGNERVLSARLTDARFFFREDRKKTLFDRVDALKHVVYQVKLGSLYDKVARLTEITSHLVQAVNPALAQKTQRAALLCKTDLLTAMVGEFPSLQGTMGREYALLEGEDPDVAQALYEHYLPTTRKGILPASVIGSLLSIAEKTDNIVGCFSIGLVPTGTADPYALRRHALGIINIILEKSFHLLLPDLLSRSINLFAAKTNRSLDAIQDEVLEFIRVRFLNRLTAQGFDHDVVEAASSAGFVDLVEVFERIKAIQELKKQPDFQPLAITFKRVVNIIASHAYEDVNPSLLTEEAEKNLYDSYQKGAIKIHHLIETRDYPAALKRLANLKPAVDNFFDGVMVMCEDQAVKANRLALLGKVAALFRGVADFAKIITE